MNSKSNFIKKVVYLLVISLLLAPLFLVGRPAITERDNAPANSARKPNPGGVLSQLRTQYKISESNLGEVNPAGETIQWATFGLKGVAAVMLWTQAMQFQKEKDYDRLSATLNQIVLIQPNYVHVWESQAHNLSYNCSAEFDGYKQRYTWVKKGLEFLFRGAEQNENQPRLLHTTGWFFGQKIGRADESVPFRREFAKDEPFHEEVKMKLRARGRGDYSQVMGPRNTPDNWLVAKQWYLAAENVIDTSEIPVRGNSPLIFFKDSAMSQINYSVRIEEEGFLDEKAEFAWKDAEKDWIRYGDRQIPHSTGSLLKLGDLEAVSQRLAAAQKEFDDLLPDTRDKLKAEKLEKLTPTQRKAYETPLDQLEPIRRPDRDIAEARMQITNAEIAAAAPAEKKSEAKRISLRLENLSMQLGRIISYRSQVNFDYWLYRCQSEQMQETLGARKEIFEGERLLKAGSLEEAKKTFEPAFVKWAEIYKKYPLLERDVTALDLVPAIKNYFRVLNQLDQPIPKDFPLKAMLETQSQNDLLQVIEGRPITGGPPGSAPPGSPPVGINTTPTGELPPPPPK
jgi:hypothetical protein